jgi:hypothetical protein
MATVVNQPRDDRFGGLGELLGQVLGQTVEREFDITGRQARLDQALDLYGQALSGENPDITEGDVLASLRGTGIGKDFAMSLAGQVAEARSTRAERAKFTGALELVSGAGEDEFTDALFQAAAGFNDPGKAINFVNMAVGARNAGRVKFDEVEVHRGRNTMKLRIPSHLDQGGVQRFIAENAPGFSLVDPNLPAPSTASAAQPTEGDKKAMAFLTARGLEHTKENLAKAREVIRLGPEVRNALGTVFKVTPEGDLDIDQTNIRESATVRETLKNIPDIMFDEGILDPTRAVVEANRRARSAVESGAFLKSASSSLVEQAQELNRVYGAGPEEIRDLLRGRKYKDKDGQVKTLSEEDLQKLLERAGLVEPEAPPPAPQPGLIERGLEFLF